jgi:hypothetical protein
MRSFTAGFLHEDRFFHDALSAHCMSRCRIVLFLLRHRTIVQSNNILLFYFILKYVYLHFKILMQYQNSFMLKILT